MYRKIQRFLSPLKKLRDFYKKERVMSLSDYLDDRSIVFLNVLTVEEALQALVQALSDADKLRSREKFYRAILQREQIVSTGIGLGIAIPHAKLANYKDFFIGVGIQKNKGLEWNALDGFPVHLIFMIGGPDNRQSEYLNILARLTLVLKNPEKRSSILKATSTHQVIDLFKEP